MNKRIIDHAKRAGIYIVPEPFDDASRSWDENMEKFAEFVLEECAARAEAYAYMSDNFLTLAQEIRELK